MILSLFSLGSEVTPAIKESQTAIEAAFKNILDKQYSFVDFASEKSFIEELSKAVAEDSIIVAATSPTYFKAFKDFVCNAFNMKCKTNKVIANTIIKSHPEFDDEFVNENALIPAGSTPLVSEDGLFSGFGIKAKKQLLIVLPLDDKRIDYIINNSLYPFVRQNMDLSVLMADPLVGMEEKASVGVTAPTKRNSGSLYDVKVIEDAVNELTAHGQTVSFANTKTIDFLGMISKSTVDLSRVSIVSTYVIEKGDLSMRDYATALAKGALETSSCTFGAALTKVFSATDREGNQEIFMYVSVADRESTNVAKLSAEPGETPPQLIYRACEEVFRMLKVCAATGYAAVATSDGQTVSMRTAPRESDDEKNLRLLKYVYSGILAASLVASLVVSLVC